MNLEREREKERESERERERETARQLKIKTHLRRSFKECQKKCLFFWSGNVRFG